MACDYRENLISDIDIQEVNLIRSLIRQYLGNSLQFVYTWEILLNTHMKRGFSKSRPRKSSQRVISKVSCN